MAYLDFVGCCRTTHFEEAILTASPYISKSTHLKTSKNIQKRSNKRKKSQNVRNVQNTQIFFSRSHQAARPPFSVRGPRGPGYVRGPFGVRAGSVRSLFGIRLRAVRGSFGVRKPPRPKKTATWGLRGEAVAPPSQRC